VARTGFGGLPIAAQCLGKAVGAAPAHYSAAAFNIGPPMSVQGVTARAARAAGNSQRMRRINSGFVVYRNGVLITHDAGTIRTNSCAPARFSSRTGSANVHDCQPKGKLSAQEPSGSCCLGGGAAASLDTLLAFTRQNNDWSSSRSRPPSSPRIRHRLHITDDEMNTHCVEPTHAICPTWNHILRPINSDRRVIVTPGILAQTSHKGEAGSASRADASVAVLPWCGRNHLSHVNPTIGDRLRFSEHHASC